MDDSMTSLPLFSWQPPCKFIPFPMGHRVGKIRDVATKMLDKKTFRAADHYRNQVTDALVRQLEKIGIGDPEIDEHIGIFWEKVREEMTRLAYQNTGNNNPKGAA